MRASHGLTKSEMKRGLYKIGEGITGRVFASDAPFVVPDIGKEPLFLNRTGSRRDLAKENISFIGVPVGVRGKTIGVLTVDRLFAPDVDFEEDIRLLKTVASIVGQAVKLHEMVEAEKAALVQENQLLREEVGKRVSLPNIVGGTKRMQEVFRAAEVVAKSRATVLLRGESGTGKELVAKAVHHLSPRSAGPYVRFNCAAVPEGLLESELFGHEKGAFTGAIGAKKGRFELADRGTIFLDEIGDLPLTLQPKILRVLQEQEFERLGSERTVRVDVRVIAATSRDLERHARGRTVPRGPLLPPQRRADLPAAAARAPRGHPGPRRPLRAPLRRGGGPVGALHAGRRGAARGAGVAGERPRAGEHRRAHRGAQQPGRDRRRGPEAAHDGGARRDARPATGCRGPCTTSSCGCCARRSRRRTGARRRQRGGWASRRGRSGTASASTGWRRRGARRNRSSITPSACQPPPGIRGWCLDMPLPGPENHPVSTVVASRPLSRCTRASRGEKGSHEPYVY